MNDKEKDKPLNVFKITMAGNTFPLGIKRLSGFKGLRKSGKIGEDIKFILSEDSPYVRGISPVSGEASTFTIGEKLAKPGVNMLKEIHLSEISAIKSQRAIMFDFDEHEQKTRELVIEKLDKLAEKDDVINAKEEIIKTIKAKSEKTIDNIKAEAEKTRYHLEGKIVDLQTNLARFLPYKRAFKTSIYFLILFLGSIISDHLLNVKIIQPFWSWLGLSISTGFLLMSYFMYSEWQENINK